jgi:hypothetical protein
MLVTAHTTLEIALQVCGHVSHTVPARLSGHPDTWCPAEGGEVDITGVRVIEPALPDATREHLAAAIMAALAESIEWRNPIEDDLADAAWKQHQPTPLR